ncbi:amino acid transporter [Deinococcus yavapaiensis]|nr:amino acid transporter [Deinococcus yavapaiensis]
MCLTGVDYFSTLGYQPGIAALAAGALSPIATLILVLVTLLGALPMYRRVAKESPHGQGSISMFENLLSYWPSKLLALALIGFVATDFVITITLSAADAAVHVVENPYVNGYLEGLNIPLTLFLVALLGGVFLKGFKEAVGLAVVLVVTYIAMSVVVIADGLAFVTRNLDVVANWRSSLAAQFHSPWLMIGTALFVFPKLALGLSGFETGVTVMPLVKGDPNDKAYRPKGRIRNTKKLLTTAALVMSALLLGSSFVATLLIPPEAFLAGGAANGRALAYLAHENFGPLFGTIYDLSTIMILWFAGASAMSGLLNIVPRYLPRYGMAPDWAQATRPLVLLFTLIGFAITLIFRADVTAQGGAYATGVLVLMSSAALAVTLSTRRLGERGLSGVFAAITVVFVLTTILNVFERPDGLVIASFFIAAILGISLLSRVARATELRVDRVEFDHTALRFILGARNAPIRFIANQLETSDPDELRLRELDVRYDTHLPEGDPVMFLEVHVADASNFSEVLDVRGVAIGSFQVLRAETSAVPNAVAAILLAVRDLTGHVPHVYFEWNDESGVRNALKFLIAGEGDTAPLTHEVLRVAEKNLGQRPMVHVGG